jgi:hypothetical protein
LTTVFFSKAIGKPYDQYRGQCCAAQYAEL